MELEGGGHSAEIGDPGHHNNITYMKKDGTVLLDSRPRPSCKKQSSGRTGCSSIWPNILEFADTVKWRMWRGSSAARSTITPPSLTRVSRATTVWRPARILMENAGNASGLNRVASGQAAAAAW